jgi:prepilin signal peptidase PulO-like enzyme (type II secretory pathway)
LSDYNGQWNRDPGWQEQRVKWRPLIVFGGIVIVIIGAGVWWLG